jgi:hypothetical protein
MSRYTGTPVNPATVLMSSAECPCAQNIGPQVASTCTLQPLVMQPTPSACNIPPSPVCTSCGPLPVQDPSKCLYKQPPIQQNCCNPVNYNVPWLGDVKKSKVKGLCNTIAGFYPTSSLQNSVTGNGTISLDTYHTKLYATSDSVVVLPDHFQAGALKKITYVKGSSTVIVTSAGNKFVQNTSLVFRNTMDQAELMWSGSAWLVLSTVNLCCNEEGPVLTNVSFTAPCATQNPYPVPLPAPVTGPTGGLTGLTGLTGN